MSDNELLLAISGMMDIKLKPVNDRLEKVEDLLENNVVPRLEKVEDTLENNIVPRLEKVEDMLENNIVPYLENAEQRLRKIELTQENNMLPRLQTIEECYLCTYKRYQSGIGQIETMQRDIEVIKITITRHSEILKKFA